MENIKLEGLANRWRRSNTLGFVAALTLAGMLAAGCESEEDYSEEGVVRTGADGRQYVLPVGAERPVYNSLEECIADINERKKQVKNELGEDIDERAEDLCEPTDTYHGHGVVVLYRAGSYYGPIVSPNSRWQSNRIASWDNNITDRSFAAPGRPVQRGLGLAPAGSTPGQRVTIKGGFGGTAKGGFAHGASS